jgi:membrane protease YdiL (CAAX protease family)
MKSSVFLFKGKKVKLLEDHFNRLPLASSLMLVSIFIGLMALVKLVDGLTPMMMEVSVGVVRFLFSFGLLALLLTMGAGKQAFITTPFKSWGPRWYLSILPISIIALVNFTGVDFAALHYSASNVAAWVLSNIGIGLAEEVMMRGVVFYLLYKAWGTSHKGVFAAVLVQALIFGLAHYVNLRDMAFIDVTFMVINATLIGIGFAGLMLVTRTIWLPVVLHSLFDMVARMNEFLLPNFESASSTPIAQHILSVVIVFLFVALPGLLYTRKALSTNAELE